MFPVSKETAFFLDGFLTTRHFYRPHFIKLPNVIMLYPDIISLSKTSNWLEKKKKKKIVRELTGDKSGSRKSNLSGVERRGLPP